VEPAQTGDPLRAGALAMLAAALTGCAPRLGPLVGAPAPARLPAATLGTHHRHLVFTWELDAADGIARGKGAARLAPPDSARLDFFLAGGMGSGAAVLIGNVLRLPPGGDAVGLLPPPALLWAALGRLAVPSVADTVARMDGTVLRADLGRPVQWRATFAGDTLRRLEHVEDGRVREWVARTADGHVRYRNESDRRTIDLVITTSVDTGPFDATLWSFR
jgi:hypothetical protein